MGCAPEDLARSIQSQCIAMNTSAISSAIPVIIATVSFLLAMVALYYAVRGTALKATVEAYKSASESSKAQADALRLDFGRLDAEAKETRRQLGDVERDHRSLRQ